MITDLPILRDASQFARHSAARQRLIAENLANADTPAYRARDLEPFGTRPTGSFAARMTRAGHEGAATAPSPVRILDLPATPNGNTVVIEEQTMRAVEAEGQHRRAMAVYSKTLELLRLGLGRLR
jgi:flagellar basal-body rod protein FlgB